MKTIITNEGERALSSSFDGVKLKFVAKGFEPVVRVIHEGDKSNSASLTLCIFLSYGRANGEFREFEANNSLPLAAILKRCLFDLEDFTGNGNTTRGAFHEALNYALNTLGSLHFYLEDDAVVAKFTFYNHYIYFVLNEEDTAFLFFEEP